jgi:hypothetical protein
MKSVFKAAGAAATAAAFFFASVLPASSADSGTVQAKVTVASPCLTITGAITSMGSLDFGTLPFSTTSGNSGKGVGAGRVENCAATAENFSVRGTNAVGTDATWTLVDPRPNNVCSAGINKYLVTPTKSPVATGNVGLSLADQLLVNVPASQWVDLSVGLSMPCSGSDGAGQNMSFQIIYTASL